MDSAGRLSFPALDRWTPGHSSLAQVVSEATASLSGQPSRADSSASPSRPGMSHAVLVVSGRRSALPSPRMEPLQGMRVPENPRLDGSRIVVLSKACGSEGSEGSPDNAPSRAPGVPDVGPQLAAMSTEELTQLLGDEQKYFAFVQKEAAKAHIVKV